jgi:hypothetical protein
MRQVADKLRSSLPLNDSDISPLEMNRRYLDANRRTYKWHSNLSDNFDTVRPACLSVICSSFIHLPIQPLGRNISRSLRDLVSELQISEPLGWAPHDLFLARYPYGHPHNILTEWTRNVLPFTIQDERRKGMKRVILGNGGSLRFDLVRCPTTTSRLN